MFRFLLLCLETILRLFRPPEDLLLENLALRQQLTVFKRRNRRPKLAGLDKLFWVLARRFWSDWKKSLLLVAPETVVRWHRAGFRLYWSMISQMRKRVGGRRIPREVRDLIFRMVAENPTWGAPASTANCSCLDSTYPSRSSLSLTFFHSSFQSRCEGHF